MKLRGAVCTVLFLSLSLLSITGGADDRDLLRFGSSKPYVFILLDTSASMNLAMGGDDRWVPGGADNPDSRIFQAKQALYDVFTAVDDVYFGFAAYNQDAVRATNKHWLYFLPVTGPVDWPLSFPAADPDGALTTMIDTLEDTDGDGVPDTGDGVPDALAADIDGDVLTLGEHFALSPVGEAGSCAAPLDLATDSGRQRAQSFALEARPSQPSILWLRQAPRTYRLSISRASSAAIGSSPLPLRFLLERVVGCQPLRFDQSWDRTLMFSLDAVLDEIFVVDQVPNNDEARAGLWNWTDVVSVADFSNSHPFTGKGWEGNYDSGVRTGSPSFDAQVTNSDPYCNGNNCTAVRPFEDTAVSSVGRPLDVGDVLPFDWSDKQKSDFLRRLAPNSSDPLAQPDFGAATYFSDSRSNGVHPPRNPLQRPLLAVDQSPLAKSINDFRCW